MRKIYAILSVVLLMAACSQQEDLNYAPKSENVTDGYVIPIEDALKTAEKFISSVETTTRSSQRTVASIKTVYENNATRSSDEENNPLYYIVNYDNNDGFAFLGADKRLQPIYAFSDERRFELSDTIESPMLKIFLHSLPTSVPKETRAVIGDVSVQLKLNEIVKPLLPASVRKWDQIAYNDSVRRYYNNDPRTAVGCVQLAAAQIFAFFKHPSFIRTSINGSTNRVYTFDWDKIINGQNKEQLCKLLEILGSQDYFDAHYGESTWASTESHYKNVFDKFNYTFLNNDHPTAFDIEKATNYLKYYNAPIYTSGRVWDISDPNNVTYEGHQWVIDGYATYKSVFDPSSNLNYYFHMVWGSYHGFGNGYYYYNPETGYTNEKVGMYAEDDKQTYTKEEGTGSYKPVNRIRMIYYYHPKL